MLILKHLTVIDGTGCSPVADMDVALDRGIITQVGRDLAVSRRGAGFWNCPDGI